MAMASSTKAAIPMVLLGITTAYLLFSEVPQAHISAGCPGIVKHDVRFGNHELDKFLCAMVQFFKYSLQTTEGLWITGYLLTTALPAVTFMAVEASRSGSSWLLSLTPLYLFLCQVGGISVMVPLIWLPVYLISNGSTLNSTKTISPWRVASIKFFLMFLEFNILAMLVPFEKINRDLAILVFQPAPVIVSLLWLPFVSTKAANREIGHKAVILVHAAGACIGVAWHLVAMGMLFREPGIAGKLLQIIVHHPGNSWCTYFAILDCVVLFAALVYLSALEDGFAAAVTLILGAFCIGPAAALSFYYMYREHNFLKECTKKKYM